jgi:hypothetical protein
MEQQIMRGTHALRIILKSFLKYPPIPIEKKHNGSAMLGQIPFSQKTFF